MHRLTLQLLAGSVLLSLASVTAALTLLWPDERAKGAAHQPQPAIHGATHTRSAPKSAHQVEKTPQKAPEPASKPSEASISGDLDRAVLEQVQNFGETPRVLPEATDEALQLVTFGDELYLLFNEQKVPRRAQLRALTRLMLLPEAPTPERLFSEQGVPLLKRPFYFGRILDPQGAPVRYPLQAARLAETLLAQSELDETGWRMVRVPLRGIDWTARAQHWLETVRRVAGDQAPLVLAVMEVESGFRPDAISRSGAVGLMQIKPDEAGQDVAPILRTRVDRGKLLDPKFNLRAGVSYLSLLQNRYLADVRDPLSREYLAIAAYNGGINAVLRQFGKTADAAIARINRLKPRQVYRILRHQFPRRETRLYLEKVTQAKARYSAWIQGNV